MRDAPHTQRGRSRPVADAPVAAIVATADELARDWLLALVAAAPLEDAARLPVAELAREAPALCAAMARALASDDHLGELAAGDLAARAGRLAGAASAADAAGAIDALREVLWSAVLAELRRPDAALVADLAARVSAVAAVVTAAALREPEPAAAPAPEAEAEPAAAPVPEPAAGPEAEAEAEPERERQPKPAPEFAAREPEFDLPPRVSATPTRPPAPAGEVDARDLRPRISEGEHQRLLERCVEAHLTDRRTLAVLLVELDGIDRLLAAEYDGDVWDAVERAEVAIEGLLRQGDTAWREGVGRVWIALAGTGPAGARALALRVAAAVEREADHRGTPLTASIGVAVFPVDATNARELAERAEDALFGAQAAGTRGAPPPRGFV